MDINDYTFEEFWNFNQQIAFKFECLKLKKLSIDIAPVLKRFFSVKMSLAIEVWFRQDPENEHSTQKGKIYIWQDRVKWESASFSEICLLCLMKNLT